MEQILNNELRSLYLYLDKGDTISVWTGQVYYMEHITFCLEYVKYL